jgi:hypothetical protein
MCCGHKREMECMTQVSDVAHGPLVDGVMALELRIFYIR